MANWKKVIVSGSNAELNDLKLSGNAQITGSLSAILGNATLPNIVSYNPTTGLFSYQTTGSLLATTASLALRTTGSLSQVASRGIAPFSFDGSTNVQIEVSGAAQLNNNQITKWDSTDGKFVNSSVFDNGTYVYGSTSLRFTGTETQLTGSFTGSFAGEFVGVTNLPDLTQGVGITAFTYDGGATATVAVSGASTLSTNKVTKWTGNAFADSTLTDNGTTATFSNNVTVNNDLVVNNNLTVFGTASFQQTTNLEVADRFILLASGSNAAGDGGLVIQQATQNVGELFGFDNGTTRWAVTSSFSANQSAFTPDAFMAAVVEGASGDPTSAPARYVAKGNIFVGNDETIWIYS
jgi:hypothetical protein